MRRTVRSAAPGQHRRRGRAVRATGAALASSLVCGLFVGGVSAFPAAAADEAPHTTIANTLLNGGQTNVGGTTISAWLQEGETLSVDLHPLKAGTGLAEGESGGGAAAITAPEGTVLDTQVFPRGAPPSVTAGGSFVAQKTGVYRITVTDDDSTLPVNLVWNIGVADKSGRAVSGRVWSTSYGIQSGAQESYSSAEERRSSFTLHAITETGARYDLTLRGYDGVGSTVQATNKGNVRVGSSDPSYLSVPMPQSQEGEGIGAQYVQPAGRSDIKGVQSYKLFLDPPAEDLPLSIAPEYRAPIIDGLGYRRSASGSNAGALTGELATQPGTVRVDVDADGDGSYDGERDVHLSTIVAEPGPFAVEWDGRDGRGDAVDFASGRIAFRATVGRTNEFHFTRIDVEASAGGISATDVTGGGSAPTALRWDDSLLTDPGAQRYSTTSATVSGDGGTDSTAGVHRWEGDDSGAGRVINANDSVHGSYGDLRAIDDWISGTEEAVAVAHLDALAPHVTLAKSSPRNPDAPVLPGARVPYRVTLTSDGTGDYVNASVLDYLDQGVLDDAELDVDSIHASHGSATIDRATGRIAWDAGTLPVGTVADLTYDVLVHGRGDRVLTNTACIAGAAFTPSASGQGTDANPCPTVTHTVGEGRLWLKKMASQPAATHGGSAEFDIVVGNSGSVDAEGVSVTDVPSLEHLRDATIEDGAGHVQPASQPVTGLSIPAGQQRVLHVKGQVADGVEAWTLPNRATLSEQPDGFEPPAIENACSDDTTFSCAEIAIVSNEGRLSIEKKALVASASHGGTVEFSIVVTNIGDRVAEGVSLTDVPTLDHVSGVTISRDGGPASSDLSVKGISLAPGASTTFTVKGVVADGVEAWTIANRARLDDQPDSFAPPLVVAACADDATASCANVAVSPVGVVPTVLASTGVAAGPVAAGALLLLVIGGGLLARRRFRSSRGSIAPTDD
ncbi:DUF11 domain-containing protein [Rathayibacter toxicus]|nr:hypothetical protein C5D35_10200 [Rathayibacter toxicus]QWL27395.1 DUF11 domain-containing protein [Rathayibacter toxicus]